jgi:hypothetical protein
MKLSIEDLRSLAGLDITAVADIQKALDAMDKAGVSISASGGSLTVELKKPALPAPVPVSCTTLKAKVEALHVAGAAVAEELAIVAKTVEGINDDKEQRKTLKATRQEVKRVLNTAPTTTVPNLFDSIFPLLNCGGHRTARMLHGLVD